MFVFPENEIHLWYWHFKEFPSLKWMFNHLHLLSEDEQNRLNRISVSYLQKNFFASRILIRSALSSYFEIFPNEWEFENSKFGKPKIKFPLKASCTQFNLSHCDDMIVCGFSNQSPVGVDIEKVSRKIKFMNLAQGLFLSEEIRHLHSLQGEEQKLQFFKYWTLKEAYIKSKGISLASDLKKIPFLIEGRKGWQFFSQLLGTEHQVAIAVQKKSQIDYNLIIKKFDFEKAIKFLD